jgi:L-ascorbate metabolism protein UlaG (beta-lactamase superfamily)
MPESAGDPGFPKHFDGKRFYNPDAPQVRRFYDLLRWKLTSRPEPSPSFIPDVEQTLAPGRVQGSGLRITLVNHSTVLLQHAGANILTDPIWSERASPLSWAGPRRHRKPGVSWEDLPRIDIVLISHNHYDHLDLPTLRRLAARGESTFIVPAGVARLLRSEKIGPVHELDWGESFSFTGSLAGVIVHSVPAMHFSSRGIFDGNKTLWCGYVLEWPERRVYFAGDTAFIGAYEPRWFMSPVHMAPDEALRAHEILGAKTSIAIHHGTFQLTDEGIDAPKKQLIACAQDPSFLVLNNGQFADIP